MNDNIFCPLVVVLSKDFTYFCPGVSLDGFENKTKMCGFAYSHLGVHVSSAGGPKPGMLLGFVPLCYKILELGRSSKLDLYFFIKYC